MSNDDTVTIRVEYDHTDGYHGEQTLTLPSWCTGDPASAAALYLFGYADAAGDRRMVAEVVDWSPRREMQARARREHLSARVGAVGTAQSGGSLSAAPSPWEQDHARHHQHDRIPTARDWSPADDRDHRLPTHREQVTMTRTITVRKIHGAPTVHQSRQSGTWYGAPLFERTLCGITMRGGEWSEVPELTQQHLVGFGPSYLLAPCQRCARKA